MFELKEFKGPINVTFQEVLTPKIVGDEIQLSDNDGYIKVRVNHKDNGVVTINGQKFYFKNGKIILKAFW